jgi:ribulose-5-phosphate 4-epimerase/fuculose-1-phosphate aldolase
MPEKRKLVEICRKVYEKGFVAATDGNISTITSANTFLITRSWLTTKSINPSGSWLSILTARE